jgi:hypothetical protein
MRRRSLGFRGCRGWGAAPRSLALEKEVGGGGPMVMVVWLATEVLRRLSAAGQAGSDNRWPVRDNEKIGKREVEDSGG